MLLAILGSDFLEIPIIQVSEVIHIYRIALTEYRISGGFVGGKMLVRIQASTKMRGSSRYIAISTIIGEYFHLRN